MKKKSKELQQEAEAVKEIEREPSFSTTRVIEAAAVQGTGLEMLHQVLKAEQQAIGLAQIFQTHQYVPIPRLRKLLAAQEIGPADLKLVAAFLTGYLQAEHFDSEFDKKVFGEIFDFGKGKELLIGVSLHALISYVEETGETTLPDRIKVSVAKRKGRK